MFYLLFNSMIFYHFWVLWASIQINNIMFYITNRFFYCLINRFLCCNIVSNNLATKTIHCCDQIMCFFSSDHFSLSHCSCMLRNHMNFWFCDFRIHVIYLTSDEKPRTVSTRKKPLIRAKI